VRSGEANDILFQAGEVAGLPFPLELIAHQVDLIPYGLLIARIWFRCAVPDQHIAADYIGISN